MAERLAALRRVSEARAAKHQAALKQLAHDQQSLQAQVQHTVTDGLQR